MKSEIVVPDGGLNVSPAHPRLNVCPGFRAAERRSPWPLHCVSTVPAGGAPYPPSATQALFGYDVPPNVHE